MSTASIDRVTLDRRVPPLGGFNLTYLGIELKRRLRNRRTLFFTVAFPVVTFVLIGLPLRDEALTDVPLAQGRVSVAAYILVSMAMYAAMVSATQTGAAVAVERSQGWSRQLRLTPLELIELRGLAIRKRAIKLGLNPCQPLRTQLIGESSQLGRVDLRWDRKLPVRGLDERGQSDRDLPAIDLEVVGVLKRPLHGVEREVSVVNPREQITGAIVLERAKAPSSHRPSLNERAQPGTIQAVTPGPLRLDIASATWRHDTRAR